jgi:phosphoribosylanthranilate isomerase
MKTKICGVTNKEDAIWAINYGADYVGLNFFKESPRHVTAGTAAKWVSEVPPFANLVGVFVDAPLKEIVDTVVKLKLKGVQLHGSESPAMLNDLRQTLSGMGVKVFIVKAFRVQDESSLSALGDYQGAADYFLLDAHSADAMGGTGMTFNWDLALKAKDIGTPIFLAGGLTPENVKDAVKKVQPFAVDVASGVEKSPKRKDLKKVQDFIQNAKK